MTQEGTFAGEHVRESGRLEEAGRRLGRKTDEPSARVATSVRERPHGLEAAGARLQHGIQVTGQRVKHGVESGRARVSREVQQHPLRVLAYAFGAGALIGLLVRTRSRRR